MSCQNVRKRNIRLNLSPSPDPEGQWAVWYTDDGVTIIRPALRFFIPNELCPAVARALTERHPGEPT